jgi:hypothetical protein
MRADADGTTNNSGGAYLKVQPVYSLSSVNGNNGFTAQTLSYCAHGAGTPVATVTCASGTTYGPPSYMWAINLSDSYDVSVSLTDALGGAVTATVTLPGAAGIWYGKGNDRLGLGEAPPGPGLYVDWDAYFDGVVDVIPRRVSKQITSSGWFRVLEYEAGNTAEASGAVGFVIDLAIGKDGIGSEAHKVSLYGVYGNVSFKDESSASQTQYIDKIRYTYQTSSPFNAYVDIHLSSNPQSVVTVDFDVSVKPSYQHLFKALALDSVPDAPSGETVLVSCDFHADISSTVKDISSAVTLNYGYDPLQKWIYVHDGMVDMFIETYFASYVADNEYIIGTITSPYRPNHLIVTTGHTTDSNFNPKGLVNFIVYANGNLGVRVNNTVGNYVIVHATYPIF